MTRRLLLLTSALAMSVTTLVSASAQTVVSTSSPLPSATAPAYLPRLLSAAEASADVALMRRALETIHPGLYRYVDRVGMNAAFATLEAAASRPITELAFYREIALMMAKIRCDHTKAELSDRLIAFRENNATHLPFRFRIIEGRMIVLSTNGDIGAPPVGAEILQINDMPVARLLRQIAPTIAYGGSTDQAIAVKLGDDSDLMGDDLNEYYPAFFGFPARWNVRWSPVGRETVGSSSLAPLTFRQWTAMASPDGDYRSEFYKSIGWRMAGTTARLSIDTFVNYRNPVDPEAFLGGFFRSMKAAGTQRLILDLRGNGGGSDDAQVALVRYLVGVPVTFSKPIRYKTIRYGDLPNFISSWGDTKSLFNPPESDFIRTEDGWFDRVSGAVTDEVDGYDPALSHVPYMDRFNGELVILSGPANASGATRTIALLKEMAGAKVIGEDSAGSAEGPTAGRILLLTLPNSGLKLRIPNAWNRTNIKQWTPAKGVAADVLVVPTLSDFQAGRDRAVTVARTNAAAADGMRTAASRLMAVAKSGWGGTIDRRVAEHRTVAPAALEIDGLELRLASVSAKNVSEDETFSIDTESQSLFVTKESDVGSTRGLSTNNNPLRLKISEFRAGLDDNVTLVADGSQKMRDETIFVRIIMTFDHGRIRITRMDRTAGTPFLLSRAYEFTR